MNTKEVWVVARWDSPLLPEIICAFAYREAAMSQCIAMNSTIGPGHSVVRCTLTVDPDADT